MTPRPRTPVRTAASPRALVAALGGLIVSGCVGYEPDPIDSAALLREIRAAAAQAPVARFDDLVDALCEHNPAVVDARARFRSALGLVHAGVPLPNPSLSVGHVILAGAGRTGTSRSGLEAGLGWALRLFGAGVLAEDVDQAREKAAGLDLAATVRAEVLALRRELVAAAVAGERKRWAERLVELGERTVELQRRLVEGGQASSLDLEFAALRLERFAVAAADARAAELAARGAVAQRCGLRLAQVPEADGSSLPVLDPQAIDDEALLDQLPESPELLALHAAHAAADAQLRLEVRRQYPDLQIGPYYEREQQMERLAIPLGFAVPLFDRNQRGIAEATAGRRAAHERFVAALRKRAAAFDTARAVLGERESQWTGVLDRLAPSLTSAREVLTRALERGVLTGIESLQLERDLVDGELQRLEAQAARFEAWMELEDAVGVPIVRFPTPESE